MTQNQNNKVAHVGEHGLKKHDLKVSTVVFMIFCLVAAGCYGIEEMIPECGPGLTIVMLCVMPFVWALPFGPVSYTHLDVYKRQGKRSHSSPSRCRKDQDSACLCQRS